MATGQNKWRITSSYFSVQHNFGLHFINTTAQRCKRKKDEADLYILHRHREKRPGNVPQWASWQQNMNGAAENESFVAFHMQPSELYHWEFLVSRHKIYLYNHLRYRIHRLQSRKWKTEKRDHCSVLCSLCITVHSHKQYSLHTE